LKNHGKLDSMFKTGVTRRLRKKAPRRKSFRAQRGGYDYSNPASLVTPALQWYAAATNGVPNQAAALAVCQSFGGTLATLAQVTSAFNAGASYVASGWGWIADGPNSQAYPIRGAAQTTISTSVTIQTPNAMANCYGPKPPTGTPNVAPWTGVAQTLTS